MAIRLGYGADTKYIANWLGIKENFINKVKGKWVDMLQRHNDLLMDTLDKAM